MLIQIRKLFDVPQKIGAFCKRGVLVKQLSSAYNPSLHENILALDFSKIPLSRSRWNQFDRVIHNSPFISETVAKQRPYLLKVNRPSDGITTYSNNDKKEKQFLRMMLGKTYEEPHELVEFMRSTAFFESGNFIKPNCLSSGGSRTKRN
jgi:hypothetical protein